ncbi:hypothetical protein B0A48_07267 [Cryoendolithus antarcticus]|uniref:Uncharacterized protein n=1 Tax=Cryoendolithus antarcticus TaxID=1507870 RepID=A0A1V8T890_9PEZI|nr:hypothetical protein B0A48_07267 [Cryoendolithus antarcticus]
MRLPTILAVLIATVAAIPASFDQDLKTSQNATSLLPRVDISHDGPDGTEWLYHLDNDKPKMEHIRGPIWWSHYPGEDKACFSDIKDDNRAGAACWGVEGHWFVAAIEKFCGLMHGKLLDVTQPINSYSMIYDYWPASKNSYGERGSIKLQVGFADGGPPIQWKYTMDYKFCVEDSFLPILNYCDNKGFNHKRGGYSNYNNERHGNDRLFWLLDPNPYVQHPYDNDQNMCTNEKLCWLPKDEHTEPLGYKFDDCRDRWSEDISPADHSINPKDCWDCSNARLDGCTKDDWLAIDNLKNHALSNYDGMTATPLPTATPAARSLALTSDGSVATMRPPPPMPLA